MFQIQVERGAAAADGIVQRARSGEAEDHPFVGRLQGCEPRNCA
jgi:hypothetical protein